MRWAERGIWDGMLSALTGADEVTDRLFIDSTCIKANRTAGGAKEGVANGIGQTRGRRNSKVHAICKLLGRPHVLMITPGNVRDMRVAKQCIAAMPPSAELVDDKGYCSNDLRDWLAKRGTQAAIANKRDRRVHHECDPAIYKQRNVIECMFYRFKDWRRVATRYARNVKNFTATIAIAAIAI